VGKDPLTFVNRAHLQIGQLNSARLRKAHRCLGGIALGIERGLSGRAFYLLYDVFLAVGNIIDNDCQPPRRIAASSWASAGKTALAGISSTPIS